MDDYLTLIGTLLGAIIGAVIAIEGAYRIERQHFARELRERIYGPMFMQLSQILEDISSFERFYADPNRADRLKGLKADYLFSTIAEDLKTRFSNIIDRLEKYQKVQYATVLKLIEKSKQKIMEASEGLNITVGNVSLNILIGNTLANALNLQTAVFLKTAPEDFIKKEKKRWGENCEVEAKFAGVKTSVEVFTSLYNSLLAEIDGEPLYLMEKQQRTLLLAELKSFLESIEPFVKPQGAFSKLTRLAKKLENRVRSVRS